MPTGTSCPRRPSAALSSSPSSPACTLCPANRHRHHAPIWNGYKIPPAHTNTARARIHARAHTRTCAFARARFCTDILGSRATSPVLASRCLPCTLKPSSAVCILSRMPSLGYPEYVIQPCSFNPHVRLCSRFRSRPAPFPSESLPVLMHDVAGQLVCNERGKCSATPAACCVACCMLHGASYAACCMVRRMLHVACCVVCCMLHGASYAACCTLHVVR